MVDTTAAGTTAPHRWSLRLPRAAPPPKRRERGTFRKWRARFIVLVLTATRDAGGAWRSARVETRRTDFQPAAGGTIEVAARIRVPPPSQGYWPAFWMLGKEFRGNYVNWPAVGEIDVMETTGREPATVFGTFHCGVAPGDPCRENDGLSGRYTLPGGRPLSADFHTYAVQWDRSLPGRRSGGTSTGTNTTPCVRMTWTPAPGRKPPATGSSCC